jgi:tRNA G18 (ribose-2'-O)-methylase SpoU
MNKQLNFQEIRTDAAERIANIKHNRLPIALLCDKMTDFRNIGSIFRIADAARLEKIYFYQSDTNFEHKKITKVARSTNQYVDFEITFQQKNTNKKLLLIIGAEKFGVSEELLKKVTTAIHLPMLGVNTSMNVSVATGIAVFKLMEIIKK